MKDSKINIVIMTPTLASHDAIGNDLESMHNILVKKCNCKIYVETNCTNNIKHIKIKALNKIINNVNSIIIYHHSVYWEEGEKLLKKAKSRIVFRYHNITPPSFFEKYNEEYRNLCGMGREQTNRFIRDFPDAFWLCDSIYNTEDLLGVPKEKISVCPPFNKTEEWTKAKPDMKILHELNSSSDINLLFVGRIVPNKGHLFLIDVVNSYVRNFGSGIRLRIIGTFIEGIDGYNQKIHNKINSLNLKNNIEFIGKVNDATLLSYYMGSDFFVSASEHEGFFVPAAEAQYLNLPVIARNSCAVPETMGENQVLLHDDPKQYAAAIHLLHNNYYYYDFIRTNGYMNYKERFLNKMIAGKFLDFLRDNFGILGEGYIDTKNISEYKVSPANTFMRMMIPKKRLPRLYIDVTETVKSNDKSGIQRVSRNIVRELYLQSKYSIVPWAVTSQNGCLFSANDWLKYNGFLPECRKNDYKGQVELLSGDIYLQIDLLCDKMEQYESLFEKMRQRGVRIVIMAYDILAINMPECFPADWMQPLWRGMPIMINWMHYIAEYADTVVAISQTVCNDVRDWIIKNHSKRVHEINFTFSYLGADLQSFDSIKQVKGKHRKLPKKNYLLMVGTIEVRKNHALAIEAMDKLFKRGIDLTLCVAGKEGWMAESAMRQLRNTDEENLWFFEQATDEELRLLYANAKGLLFVSKGEGFGLPLIEAASYGVPILCSDIPVFHEVAKEFAFYVNIDNAEYLANDIEEWWNQVQLGNIPDSSGMTRLSWAESAQRLLDTLLNY